MLTQCKQKVNAVVVTRVVLIDHKCFGMCQSLASVFAHESSGFDCDGGANAPTSSRNDFGFSSNVCAVRVDLIRFVQSLFGL